MSVKGKLFAVFLTLVGMTGSIAADAIMPSKTDIRLQGRADVVVTDPVVRLSDIAHIESAAIADDEAMVELRKIVVGQSPKAGESKVLEGAQILEKLRDAGVRLDSLVYTFPRQITVTRAYREVAGEELEKALKLFLASQERPIEVKHLITDKPVKIPADSFGVEVIGVQPIQPGHYGIDYRSRAGQDEVRFQMRALADEWRMMPVASRPLKRGDLIAAGDVRLSKMNATVTTSESIEQIGDVVGRALVRDVGQGEMFSSAAVIIPPLVTVGSRVTMLFRHGRLEVSASGTALESGIERQEIKVRNETSQKVIKARVIDKGMVEVGAN